MDEPILFDRIHEALDVEVPGGAYERLRVALTKTPVKARRWSSFQVRLSLRVAAVLTALVLGVAVLAAIVTTHHVAEVTPADSAQAIAAYKKMVYDDWTVIQNSEDPASACTADTGVATCEAAVSAKIRLGNQLLNDLDHFQTPARFAVVEAQLRRHAAAQNSYLNELLAASQARDVNRMDRARAALIDGRLWLDAMLSAISYSQQATAAGYTASVREQQRLLDTCTACQNLATQVQMRESVVADATAQVARFQGALVESAAPTSLAAKDKQLQLDLARADTALLTMKTALLTGDQAGFDTARTSLRNALTAVGADAAGIVNG